MIDLHGHYLPGLDDGAADLSIAVAMCRMAAADGCEAIVATPHLRRDEWPEVTSERIAAAVESLQAAVGSSLRVLAGAEVRVDSDLLDDLERQGAIVPLAGSRYLLLELDPWGIGPEPVELVQELALAGWRPIVAHPEVTPFLIREPQLLERIVEAGGHLQITAASVTGEYGRGPRDQAHALLDADLVHFVASDTHAPDFRPPGLRRAHDEIVRTWGEALARRLCVEHPRSVLEDRPIASAQGGVR